MTKCDDARRPTKARELISTRTMRSWRASMGEALATVVAGGGATYDRRRTLPRLIAFDVRDLAHAGPELDVVIRSRLKRALRAERRRGVAGHWTYDLNRHLGLMQALAAEEERERLATRV